MPEATLARADKGMGLFFADDALVHGQNGANRRIRLRNRPSQRPPDSKVQLMQQTSSKRLAQSFFCLRGLVLGLAAIAAIPALLLVGCDSGPQEAVKAPPPGVLVAKVVRREISELIECVGRTVAVNDVSLRAQVECYLLERRFEEGQDVEQGTELFVIEPALWAAGVAAAEGAVGEEVKAKVVEREAYEKG